MKKITLLLFIATAFVNHTYAMNTTPTMEEISITIIMEDFKQETPTLERDLLMRLLFNESTPTPLATKDVRGNTWWHLAAYKADGELLEKLNEHNVEGKDSTNEQGQTPRNVISERIKEICSSITDDERATIVFTDKPINEHDFSLLVKHQALDKFQQTIQMFEAATDTEPGE